MTAVPESVPVPGAEPLPVPVPARPEAPPKPPVLTARDAAVTVDGAELLPSTSVELRPGECVAVLGPNGAGKTTLLRVLAGRLRPTSGAVRLRGGTLDERRIESRREIAALIEPPALYPDLTVREQLSLIDAVWAQDLNVRKQGRGRGGIPRTAAFARRVGLARSKDQASPERSASPGELLPGLGAEALERFDLCALEERFPHELSSGQRQLVCLAVTFARPANVLLLDEPEQRLDPDRRELVADAIGAARERGAAVVFSSHDPELVDRAAERRLRVGA